MYAYIQVVSQKYLEWGNITVLAIPLLQVSFVPFKVDPFPTICTRPSVSSSAHSISGTPVHDAVESHLRFSLNRHTVFESYQFNWIFIFGKRNMLGKKFLSFFFGGGHNLAGTLQTKSLVIIQPVRRHRFCSNLPHILNLWIKCASICHIIGLECYKHSHIQSVLMDGLMHFFHVFISLLMMVGLNIQNPQPVYGHFWNVNTIHKSQRLFS